MQQSSPPTEGKGSNDVRENQWTTDHTAYGDSCMVDTSTIGHGNVRMAGCYWTQ